VLRSNDGERRAVPAAQGLRAQSTSRWHPNRPGGHL